MKNQTYCADAWLILSASRAEATDVIDDRTLWALLAAPPYAALARDARDSSTGAGVP